MQELIVPILGSLIRHAATAGGLAGIASGDQANVVAGAIATLAGFGWSVLKALKEKKQG